MNNKISFEYYKYTRINYLKKFEKCYYTYLKKNNLLNQDLNKHAENALILYYSLLKSCKNLDFSNKLVLKQIICKK